jgi:hypothetical protein
MSRRAALRLFLLLLLACDWAGDAFHGLSPFSRPLSSTEVVCPSIVLRPAGPVALAGHLPIPSIVPALDRSGPSAPTDCGHAEPHPTLLGGRVRTCLFMSWQC